MEDRGWRIAEALVTKAATMLDHPSSILHPRSSILDPPSSILHPLFSIFHHRADVTKAHDVIAEREASVITHFLGGTNKSAERDSREHAAYTYSLHPDLRKFR